MKRTEDKRGVVQKKTKIWRKSCLSFYFLSTTKRLHHIREQNDNTHLVLEVAQNVDIHRLPGAVELLHQIGLQTEYGLVGRDAQIRVGQLHFALVRCLQSGHIVLHILQSTLWRPLKEKREND